ncbi:MAG: hypothetical protein WBP41_20915 [Saprospiraceae bacterium]
MKKLILFLFCLPSVISFSQRASTWKGNCPGHAFDWQWAANWSTNSRPDEFTDVIIPLDITDSSNYPHITASDVEINSLYMSPGANLFTHQFEIRILDLTKSYFRQDQIQHKLKLKNVREITFDELLNASR